MFNICKRGDKMLAIKNNLGLLTAIIITILAVPFVASLFYGIPILDSLNNLSALENLAYGFLGAVYLVGGLAIMLVGVPCLIDKIFNK
jgi:hypothetical protein